VRYWLLGPEKGKKVDRESLITLTSTQCLLKIVLINGLSIPTIIWKEVAPRLASNGYRLLLYGMFRKRTVEPLDNILLDLYGRGYSDAPQTTYDATFYATQLALLMQHVKWDRAHIIGLSMVSINLDHDSREISEFLSGRGLEVSSETSPLITYIITRES
jgi:pimeloyl-ACP methyl ester carboxylesterase